MLHDIQANLLTIRLRLRTPPWLRHPPRTLYLLSKAPHSNGQYALHHGQAYQHGHQNDLYCAQRYATLSLVIEMQQILLLPPHTRHDIMSEVLGTPCRFKAIAADIVIVESFDEELEDEDTADGGYKGIDEEEVGEGGD